MDRYEALFKGFGNRLLNRDAPENQELFTVLNALSRQNIDKAMAQERNLHHIGTPQHPYVTPPKIRNNQVSGSAKLRDCLVTLRDIQRTPTDGTTSEGIAPYLTTVSRIAEGSNLDIPSFYDLLKSRIIVDSTLYKEVSRHQKMNQQQLCTNRCASHINQTMATCPTCRSTRNSMEQDAMHPNS